ncbi:MAG: carbon-nitrogen hydrolase family protein, partial [Candidatus Poribacteria bacterium]|nr:carbon-nitrogen hydrolase family protein [Candidatus Poribacteria bacterium]
VVAGVSGGTAYRVEWAASVSDDVGSPRDDLRCKITWESDNAPRQWDYLLPTTVVPSHIRFSRTVVAPNDATQMIVQSMFRWSATGRVVWSMPTVEAVALPESRPPVNVAVVTGKVGARRGPFNEIQDNINFYLPLCEAAAQQTPDLIILPEIALQWHLKGSALDLAVSVDAPETLPFRELAKRHSLRLLLGMFERDGDAVYNSAVLIGTDGEVEGVYRKVHLAVGGEDDSGILPGAEFPVWETPLGRIGCNICMDSSAAESSRMIGLNGADFLLMPIMGDHRSDRWSPGSPIYSEDRWKAIQRAHAIDTQLCMVIARNTSLGSCVIDRKGDILAWNEGDRDFVLASVNLDDGYRTWNGGCFRDVNWVQRRPELYGTFIDAENIGGSESVLRYKP